VTGAKVLYVNRHFTRRIVEMSHAESEALLRLLTGWVTQPRFTVRYRWTAGTIAVWDNRCTQHSVINDFEGERIIQRATITGDRPEGGPARWKPFRPDRVGALTRHDRQLLRFLKASREQQA
jgi:taurine dioxygenase